MKAGGAVRFRRAGGPCRPGRHTARSADRPHWSAARRLPRATAGGRRPLDPRDSWRAGLATAGRSGDCEPGPVSPPARFSSVRVPPAFAWPRRLRVAAASALCRLSIDRPARPAPRRWPRPGPAQGPERSTGRGRGRRWKLGRFRQSSLSSWCVFGFGWLLRGIPEKCQGLERRRGRKRSASVAVGLGGSGGGGAGTGPANNFISAGVHGWSD